MSYLISDIRKSSPENNEIYLFDANVWLAVLEGYFYEPQYYPYKDFFNKIIRNRVAPDAYIGMSSLLISEIINRAMKTVHYFNFCKDNKIDYRNVPKEHYKETYRKTRTYINDLEYVCSNIRDYESKIKLVSDELNLFDCKNLIKDIPPHLDMNDYLYSKMALAKNYIIVTNDSDFSVEGIRILTTLESLIKLNP